MKQKDSFKKSHGLTVYPSIPLPVARESFIKSVGKVSDAQNTYLDKFVQAGDTLLATTRTVCLQDFLYALAAFEIPTEETKKLFALWSEKMTQMGKIEPLAITCYDWQLFTVN